MRERATTGAGPIKMLRTYLITFTTYGTWLHGDARSSVHQSQAAFGSPMVGRLYALEAASRRAMTQPAFLMGAAEAAVVHDAIAEVCRHRDWTEHALHVRSNHVHVLVSADRAPERVMNDFKAYGTRALIRASLAEKGRRVWARHGSTRWIDSDESFEAARRYVLHEQGKPLQS